MLRFNGQPVGRVNYGITFKYISCYGSTAEQQEKLSGSDKFKYISCYGSTNRWRYNNSSRILI